MTKLIFIFLDGVGIGPADRTNPFYAAKSDYLPFYGANPRLPDNTPVKPIDACLDTPGVPMSATGQTTLYTGINTPKLLGAHKDSYPDKSMRKVIKEKNLFSRLKRQHNNVRFLNAYPYCAHVFTPQYIRIQQDGSIIRSAVFNSHFKGPLSVTSCMMVSSYMSPFNENDILRERALYHDYSNMSLNRRKQLLPLFTPEQAADIVFNTSRKYDLLLYEFFETDMYGHGFEMHNCINLVQKLNRLLKQLVSRLDKEKDTLILTSDHGNLEDSITQLHTANPVPLVTWGKNSDRLRNKIESLTHITPAIVDFFQR
ncbi:MAG: hypothetical protein GY757_22315 [bacterium]|nr:hypothetical protein [bacterium]